MDGGGIFKDKEFSAA